MHLNLHYIEQKKQSDRTAYFCRYQQIMHYHMQNEEYGKVVDACKRYGDSEVCLWEQALGYFARKEENCKAYISEVLQHIDENNLMPPLLGE